MTDTNDIGGVFEQMCASACDDLHKRATDLAERIETHLAVKDASPGFHLSDDDMRLIASALRTASS